MQPKPKPSLKQRLFYATLALWLSFGLTGVGLFWSGHLSGSQLKTGIQVLSRVLMPCVKRLLLEEEHP